MMWLACLHLHRWVIIVSVAVGASSMGRPVASQTSPDSCTQDCRLFLGDGRFFGLGRPSVFQGIDRRPLGRMVRSGGFDTLFAGNDSAMAAYKRFARADGRTMHILVIGLGAIAATALTGDSVDPWLAVGGGTFAFVGSMISGHRSRRAFERAIEWYNRDLPEPTRWTP